MAVPLSEFINLKMGIVSKLEKIDPFGGAKPRL